MTASLTLPQTLIRPTLVVVLPRCTAPEAHAICLCGGLLAYLLGGWWHVDFCLDCVVNVVDQPDLVGGDCSHRGCCDPEPVTCTHEADWSCGEPASLTIRCAHGREDQSCCGCCWVDAGSVVPGLVGR